MSYLAQGDIQGYGGSTARDCIKAIIETEYVSAMERRLAGHPEILEMFKKVSEEAQATLFARTRNLLSPAAVVRGLESTARYKVEIDHNCTIVACGNNFCTLCAKSPERRCGPHCLKEKYTAGKGLVSKCDQPLIILLKYNGSDQVAKISGDVVISLVNSQDCTAHFQDRKPLCSENFRNCLVDSKYAHLSCGSLSGTDRRPDGLVIPMKDGRACIPRDITTETTTICAFKCKSVKYQLLIRVIPGTGNMPASEETIAYISRSFTTLTSRAMLSQKRERPLTTDGIKTLDKVGRRRVEKFHKLSDHIQNEGLPRSIKTVGEFRDFAKMISPNALLESQVLSALRIPADEWRIMCKNANQALEHDDSMRSWSPLENVNGVCELLYACERGRLDLASGPIAIVRGESIVRKESWDTALVTMIDQLHNEARSCWWQANHPQWKIFESSNSGYERMARGSCFTHNIERPMGNLSGARAIPASQNPLRAPIAPMNSKVIHAPSIESQTWQASAPGPAPGAQCSSSLSLHLLHTSDSPLSLERHEALTDAGSLFLAEPSVVAFNKPPCDDANVQKPPAQAVFNDIMYENQPAYNMATSDNHLGIKRKRAQLNEYEAYDYPYKVPALMNFGGPTSSTEDFTSQDIGLGGSQDIQWLLENDGLSSDFCESADTQSLNSVHQMF